MRISNKLCPICGENLERMVTEIYDEMILVKWYWCNKCEEDFDEDEVWE